MAKLRGSYPSNGERQLELLAPVEPAIPSGPEKKFFGEVLPPGWMVPEIQFVGELRLGKQRSPENRSSANSTKYLRAANLTWKGLELSEVFEMDFSPEEVEHYRLRRGDIVLSEASGSPEHVGKPAIWNDELPLCCFQNTVIRFRAFGIVCEYALLVFRHYALSGVFVRLVRGVGIAHLGLARLARIPFPLPSLQEQRAIVASANRNEARLNRAENHLREAEKKLALGEASVLKQTFKDGITDCPQVALREIATATNGRAFKSTEWSETGLPIVRIQNLKDGLSTHNKFDGEVDPKHIVSKGELLFAWSGTPGTSFGPFIWNGSRSALNQHIFKLEVSSTVDKSYLYFALKERLAHFIAKAQGGGGLAHVTRDVFLNTKIPLPDMSQQARIASSLSKQLNHLHAQECTVRESMKRVNDLRRSLLERAIHGRLVAAPKRTSMDDTLSTIEKHKAKAQTQEGERKKQSRLRHVKTPRNAAVRPLQDVLSECGPLPAESLFDKAGYKSDDASQIESFYHALRGAMKAGSIASQKTGEVTLWRGVPQ